MEPQVNIDIKQTTPITSEDGNIVFQEVTLLRKASKFLTGSSQDTLIPIPAFMDIKTSKLLIELLPKDLRDEYTEYNKTL